MWSVSSWKGKAASQSHALIRYIKSKQTKKEDEAELKSDGFLLLWLVAGNLMQTWRKRGQPKKIVGKRRDSWHRSEGCGFMAAARAETNLVIRPNFALLIPGMQFIQTDVTHKQAKENSHI